MDYEKKYNEALERAREIKEKIMYSHLSTESCKAVSEYIDTIIPELRESEDERIRYKLYCTVLGTPDDSEWFHDVSKDSMLAYLEKQKEQEPAEPGYKHEDYFCERCQANAFNAGRESVLKEQKEQDNYDTIFYKGMMYYRKRMMEEAVEVEGVVIDNGSGGTIIDTQCGVLYLPPLVYAVGNKVRIVVIKEEEGQQ